MKKSYTKPEVINVSLSSSEIISASFESFKGLSGIGTDVGITSYAYTSQNA